MKRVLLLGASGQLGNLVKNTVPVSMHLKALSRADLDLTDRLAVSQAVQEYAPAVIINTAAYTQVDKAEAEEKQAFEINATAVEHLAATVSLDTRIIHLSTDFVFSEHQKQPYKPDAAPLPVSVYGRSKLAGESALLAADNVHSIILRTSWLYSAMGRNFVTTMIGLLNTREELVVVNDQFGSPTSAVGLANVIWRFVMEDTANGVYHWSDQGVITWYDFAREIQSQGLELGILDREIPIKPVPTSGYPTPAARRPFYSALDSSATEAVLGIRTTPWQEPLRKVLEKLKETQ
ncbi:MAG: dTDP-4-dehydrorhamnose reductase [Gammaproteobacteria bacterium]|nr:dTDP-4-dehydrorhamnose reductase [Gammaproteobacteria bacterium]